MKKLTAIIFALLLTLSAVSVLAEDEYIGNKNNWRATVSSNISYGTIDKAFDGKKETYWHSNYTAEGSTITGHDNPPFDITVIFPQNETVAGISYTGRQDASTGRWKAIEVYVASTENDTGVKVFSGTLEDTADAQSVRFAEAVSAKKIVIRITESVGNYGTAAEIEFVKGFGTGKNVLSGVTEEAPTYTFVENKNAWRATATSEKSWGTIDKAFDGNLKSNWHTDYAEEDGKITGHDECPHTVTVTFPAAEDICGVLYTPRQDNSTGRWKAVEIYASESGSDKGVSVFDGTAEDSDKVQFLDFKKTVKAKTITIVVKESVDSYGAAAEIEFVKSFSGASTSASTGETAETSEGKKTADAFDTKAWKVSVNSQISSSGWGAITNILDGDEATYWHSKYTAEGSTITGHDNPPYEIDITLPESAAITGFELLPRQDKNTGMVYEYELYAAPDDSSDYTLIYAGTLDKSYSWKTVEFFCGITVKRLRFKVLDASGGYGTMAELRFTPAGADDKIVPYEELTETMNENRLYQLDSSQMTITNDLPTWAGEPYMLLDGDSATFWQTDEISKTGHDPVTIDVDLGKENTFSVISVSPRQSGDFHGYWEQFNIWVSRDGENWDEILHDYSFGLIKNLDEKKITFDTPVTARYVEFEITQYSNYRVSCAEIRFWQSKKDYDVTSDAGRYILTIGSKEIRSVTGAGEHTTTIDVAPFISAAGSTLIPLRGLLEQMGVTVTWHDEDQSIVLTKDAFTITLQVMNKNVYVNDPRYGMTRYTLTTAPRIVDSRTFVPVRFISEQMGYTVDWDGATQTVTVTKE